jgi:RHS repeat-associated protein
MRSGSACFWVSGAVLLASASCRGPGETSPPTPAASLTADGHAAHPSRAADPPEGTAGPAASPEAGRTLAALRARAGGAAPNGAPDASSDDASRILPAGLARTFRRVDGGLRPQFSSSEPVGARVLLPTSARGAFRLEDTSSGLNVEVTLDGARDVDAQVSDGYLVYAGAPASGGTLLHRALPAGLEDYISFDARPRRAGVSYTFTPGATVKGLRLVANTLELVDAGGAPRLRVEPPSIVGADGVRTSATLAVEGCAVDYSPAAPWGRAPTRPGHERCGLRVSWPAQEIAYPAVLDPRWTSTMTMNAKRQGHTATLLSTGKVLVVGGSDGTNALNTAELFDPATGTWTPTATFTGPRQLHTAVQLGTNSNTTTSGKVLVAGGWSGGTTTSGAAVNTALLYNVATGAWTAAAALNAARAMHTATVLPSGQVLVAGGMSDTATVLNTAALYNPTTGAGTWTATGAMAIKARFHTATLMPTTGPFANKVVVVGGNTGGTTSMAVVQLFNGTTWTSAGIAQLPAAREGHTATLLANGNLLVTGGKTGTTAQSSTLLFNAATAPGTWASAGTMNATHAGHTATLLSTSILSSGQVLVAGGAPTTTNSAEVWNGTTTWTPTTPLSSVIAGHTATLLNSKLVLIAGGTSAAGASAAQLYDPSFALTCTTNSQCGSGFCVSGVCCDTACNAGCGACNLTGKVGTCSPVASATVCRAAAAGGCDVAETCNGTALACPTDAFAANTVTCRAAVAGGCDVAEKCTGTSAACPPDTFAANTVTCRAANGACDVAEKCTGTSSTCPTDAFLSSTTVCRPAVAGGCDVAETCSGTSAACPADVLAPNTTVCRPANGACDVAEKCTGTSTTCPSDGFAANTTVCRPAVAGGCDVAETCSGTSAACPADVLAPNTTVCRPANGACDVAEKCTGTSTTCPIDGFAASTTVCRAAKGICDVAETCTGTSGACPTDGFAPTTVVCRASNGPCDAQESCTGSSPSCPADVYKPNGTLCDDFQRCTTNDQCTNGACSGTNVVCAAPDQCHLASSCNPQTGTCALPEKPNGTVCDDGNPSTTGEVCEVGVCRTPASYQTASTFLPEDLGTLGGSITNPTAINASGQIVGNATSADGVEHAFTWSAEQSIQDLGASPGFPATSVAIDVNDAGEIAGTLTEPSGSHHAFRYAASTVLDLGVLGDDQPDEFGDRGSYITAENAAGDLTGYYTYSGDVQTFRYTESRGYTFDIGGIYGRQTIGYDISDAGSIVGVSWVPNALPGGIRALGHALLSDADYPGDYDLNDFIDPTSGWTLVNAKSISPNGTYIVGTGDLGGQLQGYRFNRTTGVIDELPSGWTGDVYPYAVNDDGKVAGTGFPTPSSSLTGWIYTDQVGFQTLNDVVGSASGWTISVASAINAAGDITGYGTYKGSLTRGFRLRMGTVCPSSCPASDQCHAGACDPTTGACTNIPKPNGTTCDDGLPSTSGETCQVGLCRAPTSYPPVSNLEVDDLGDLGGRYSIADDINSSGVVVGGSTASNGTNQAFIWSSPGNMIDLGAESTFLANSGANAINDAGMIVGGTTDGTNGEHVYRFTETNFVEDLGVVGDNSVSTTDVFTFQGATASDVNESGDLSGYFSMNGQTHGFRYSNGAFDDIGSLHGGLTYAWGIDEAGDVVGSSWVPNSVVDNTVRRLGHAIIWNQILSDPVDLNEYVEPSSGWVLHSASDISDNGRYIVGTGEINGVLRAFRLDTTTGTIVEVSNFPGDAYGEAVNNNGDVAGTGHNADNTTQAGFIYTDQLGFRKLNDIIDPASGWNIEVLNGINEDGDVVGWGDFQGQRPRAMRVHQIVTPQQACLGKAEGDPCDHGTFCPNNNVCHLGVCGGADPADNVCLSVDGVVDVQGRPVALFGFDNLSGSTVIPEVSQELVNGVVVGAPQPAPPPWLPAGYQAAAFRPPFSNGDTVSWRVNGQMVTTNSTPTLTPLPNVPGVQVSLNDGSPPIVVQADLASFKAAPTDPTTGDEPSVGSMDPNFLSGTLTVSQSGASVYTIPIALPPGIGGMAPNLSLVYNSQGENGIAGQGWDLTGLSVIELCPKTRVEDGTSEQVDVSVVPAKGGVCLDGKRLFDQGDGTYKLEISDHSLIRKDGDGFTVITKDGEERYYGHRTTTQVPASPDGTSSPAQTAIWPLDEVFDRWGNYYMINYNEDDSQTEIADFQTRGLIVTSIHYTGHFSTNRFFPDGLDPYANVKFTYDPNPRKDARRLRLGQWSLPENRRLTKIETPLGYYSLAYLTGQAAVDDTMLPSQLSSITYCPDPTGSGSSANCMQPTTFDWQGGGFSMMPADAFAPPVAIDNYFNNDSQINSVVSRGTAFVDLDGDGRADLVKASPGNLHAWKNNGSTFVPSDNWALPINLVDGDGQPAGSALADMNGDGILDFVENPRSGDFCVYSGDEGSCAAQVNIRAYVNRIKDGCPGNVCWQPMLALAPLPSDWGNANIDLLDNKDYVVDMNGDGRADLARIVPPAPIFAPCQTRDGTQQCIVGEDRGDLKVLLNMPTGWVDSGTEFKFSLTSLPGNIDGYHLEDINRDGLTDLVANNPASDGTYSVGLNTGSGENAWTVSSMSADPNRNINPGVKQFADINGDGLFDTVKYFEDNGPYTDSNGNPTGYSYVKLPAIAASTGLGYLTNVPATSGFLNALMTLGPQAQTNGPYSIVPNSQQPEEYFGMADLNGDGLADLVINRGTYGAWGGDGGRVFVNGGDTWKDITGATTHQTGVVQGLSLPVVPAVYKTFGDLYPGAAFVDLNGDGITDLVQSTDASSQSPKVRHAWLNTFKPPMITGFPNGRALKTQVSYDDITSNTMANSSYIDTDPIVAGTTVMTPPIRVVTSISAEDGRAIGSLAATTYKYESFRGSAFGRGGQGFKRVTISQPGDTSVPNGTLGTTTVTEYSQLFPYTGMPTLVTQKKGSTVLSTTSTKYCDAVAPSGQTPTCTAQDTSASATSLGVDFPVYTTQVINTSYLIGSSETIVTTTDLHHDKYGNQIDVTVDTKRSDGQEYKKTTTTSYGADGSDEQQQGKATSVSVLDERVDVPDAPISHDSSFTYSYFSGGALALTKAVTESDAPASENATTQTEYDYDKFGHVITTTECASDFDSCAPGATNPADSLQPPDPLRPPFRTTRTSYDASDLNYLAGPGLRTVVPYPTGRFPVKTTNAEGDVEYVAYDAALGVLVQRLGADGLHTCYDYDPVGRQTAVTERCGSSAPLRTTTVTYDSVGFAGPLYPVVTLTRPPSGAASWAYTDVLGRTGLTLTRGLDGSLIETGKKTFDMLGRTATESQPRFYFGGGVYQTTHQYDPLGPETTTTKDLGNLGGNNASATSQVSRVLQGSTTQITEQITVDDQGTKRSRMRTEATNVLGKLSKVTTTSDWPTDDPATVNGSLTYQYDVDGNLTTTTDQLGNVVSATYDHLNRKTSTTDGDMGSWGYTYDGFGDLAYQDDGNESRTTMTYDVLGRVITRADQAGTASWTYSTSGVSLGKLVSVIGPSDPKLKEHCDDPDLNTSVDGNRALRWFHYNDLGELEEAFECADGVTSSSQHIYDTAGRESLLRYPDISGSRLSVRYNYTSTGHLQFLSDDSDGSVIWQALQSDASGQIASEELRNGVQTTTDRNPGTGWVMSANAISHAESDAAIQGWSYKYDEAGNVKERDRAAGTIPDPSVETFQYDALDRLLSSRVQVNPGGPRAYDNTDTYTYDIIGNLRSKRGDTEGYDSSCSAYTRAAGPHALCVFNGSAPFSYDDNGNLLSGNGRTMEYNPRNKVVHIADSSTSTTVDFAYGPDGDRVTQEADALNGSTVTADRTVYFALGGTGKSLYERTAHLDANGNTTSIDHVQFVYAGAAHGGNAFAVRKTTTIGASTSTASFSFYHFDHLGSVTAISDETGNVVDSAWGNETNATIMGYDPWGKRRSPDGKATDSTKYEPEVGHREFTSHEMIPTIGLINMNGRVYDPGVGRFLSADPNIQSVSDQQSYNRYSYVLNNPLKYTDPTGFRTHHVFSDQTDQTISGFLQIGTMAACAWVYTCIPALAINAAWSAASVRASGGSWDQVIAVTVVDVASTVAGYAFPAAAPIINAGSTLLTNAILNRPIDAQTALGLLLDLALVAEEIRTNPVSQGSENGGNGPQGGPTGSADPPMSEAEYQSKLKGRPTYDPAQWNDGGTRDDGTTVQGNSNCYAYATNQEGPFDGHFGMQPGDKSGAPQLTADDVTVPKIRARAIADGLSPVPVDGGYPVYLVVSPGTDYHWYREDSTGLWSHKPGSTPVTNVDASGNLIVNPELANHAFPSINYYQPGGYLWVPPGFHF